MQGKAQKISVTNCHFHDGLNCGIDCKGAHEILIANNVVERTRMAGVNAAEDHWWAEGAWQVRRSSPLVSFIHSLHAFQSADQVRCSRHSMAALQPALSWDFLHHVIESSATCRSSLT